MKTNYLVLALLIFGFISINAQSKETQEKIKELKGDVTKITIETTDGEVEIEGEDAAKMMKKMKSHKQYKIKHMSAEGSGHENVMIFHEKGMHNGDITIDVDMDDIDGEKVVIIKKNIDGKEVVEEYKGEDAEKYMKEHSGSEHSMKIITEDGDVHVVSESGDNELVWITEGEGKEVEKTINIEVSNGVKKVTITTTEDGEKKVEVLEGEDAEKYLESNTHHKQMKIHVSEDGDEKMKKVFIIKEVHEEHDSDKEGHDSSEKEGHDSDEDHDSEKEHDSDKD